MSECGLQVAEMLEMHVCVLLCNDSACAQHSMIATAGRCEVILSRCVCLNRCTVM